MKHAGLILLFLFACFHTYAQQHEYDDDTYSEEEEEDFVGFKKQKKDLSRFRLGGNVGFAGSEFMISFELSPEVGYQVVEDRLEVGIGAIYQYTNIRKPFISYPSGVVYVPAKINISGGTNYVRIYIWEGIFAQMEGLLINYRERPKDNNSQLLKLTLGNVLAGGGYQYNAPGSRVYLNVGLMTNLIINPLYPRRTIIPQFGIQFAL